MNVPLALPAKIASRVIWVSNPELLSQRRRQYCVEAVCGTTYQKRRTLAEVQGFVHRRDGPSSGGEAGSWAYDCYRVASLELFAVVAVIAADATLLE